MSIKSIILSVVSVLLFYGFLALILFLFGIHWIVGIIGIVLTLVIPPILMRKAISSANGFVDKLIAKIIVPILYLVGIGATLLTYFYAFR